MREKDRKTAEAMTAIRDARRAKWQAKVADAMESFEVTGIEELNEGTTPKTVKVVATGAGEPVTFDAVVRIDTPGEADYYRHGGIMQYVLRSILARDHG